VTSSAIEPRAESAAAERGIGAPCSLRQLIAYFLKLGAVGFGGPIALVG